MFARLYPRIIWALGAACFLSGCGETEKVVFVTGLQIDPAELSMTVGQTETVTVSVYPEDAETPALTWTSSDPETALVEDGFVTALAEGKARIIATAGTVAAVCTVTVKATAP